MLAYLTHRRFSGAACAIAAGMSLGPVPGTAALIRAPERTTPPAAQTAAAPSTLLGPSPSIEFSHAPGQTGMAPPPANAVNAAPDPGDVFLTTAPIGSPSFANSGNSLAFDNLIQLGLMPGDNIDAWHAGSAPLPASLTIPTSIAAGGPRLYFSVREGSLGAPGSGVNAELPINQSHVFFSGSTGTNFLSVRNVQMGLNPDAATDGVDGLWFFRGFFPGCVYFSLAPGSPTLAAMGASPADIFMTMPGGGAVASVAFSAASLGLLAGDDVDGLIIMAGDDADGNCIYSFPEDYPLIVFSVAAGSVGAPGTTVASYAAAGPIGAHVFCSTAPGGNMIFATPARLGLLATDDIDALETTVPTPLGDPVPPPPPPPPPGPEFFCDPGGAKFSLCEDYTDHQVEYCTAQVDVACGGMSYTFTTVICVVCDGNPIPELTALAAWLAGLICPCDGLPIFSAVGVTAGPSPTRGQVDAIVGTSSCKITHIGWYGARGCKTKDLALLAFQGQEVDPVCCFVRFDGGNAATPSPGQLVLHATGEPQLFFPVNPGQTRITLAQQVSSQLNAMGWFTQPFGSRIKLNTSPSVGPVSGIERFGFPNGNPGPFWTMGADVSTRPQNDDCTPVPTSGATPVTSPSTTRSNNFGAQGSDISSCGTNDYNDVWFSFTPQVSDSYIIDTEGSTSLADTTLAVYSPGCPPGPQNGCDDDGGTGMLSRLQLPLIAGQPYKIRVAGYNGDYGNFNLNIQAVASGACCHGAGCSLQLAANCVGTNRQYAGHNSVCNVPGNNLVPCCKADFNKNGTVTVQDIFDFLAGYFSQDPGADFNGSGTVTVQDLFSYLAAWFAKC